MSDLGGWHMHVVRNSKRLECRKCGRWTGTHRWWFVASRELRRHTRQEHGRRPRGMQPAKVQMKPRARDAGDR